MDRSRKERLLEEVEEMRSFALRVSQMGRYLTDAADQERLAVYAADLKEYASRLEEQASSAESEPPPSGCVMRK